MHFKAIEKVLHMKNIDWKIDEYFVEWISILKRVINKLTTENYRNESANMTHYGINKFFPKKYLMISIQANEPKKRKTKTFC